MLEQGRSLLAVDVTLSEKRELALEAVSRPHVLDRIGDLLVLDVGLMPELVGEKTEASKTFRELLHERIHALEVPARHASEGRDVGDEKNLALEVAKALLSCIQQLALEIVNRSLLLHLGE